MFRLNRAIYSVKPLRRFFTTEVGSHASTGELAPESLAVETKQLAQAQE